MFAPDHRITDTKLAVTPLDVVRVRLQSQEPRTRSNPVIATSKLVAHSAGTSSFTKLPHDLGITTCCRDLFWVNSSHHCIAEGNLAGFGAAAMQAGDCAVEDTKRKRFTSSLDGLRKIYKYEGFTTLWRGLTPTLAMAVPGNVVYFAGYDTLLTSDKSPIKKLCADRYAPIFAGLTARVVAALFVSPIELVRTRMQAAQTTTAGGSLKNTMHDMKGMIKTHGYRTLWRGLTFTLWRDVPFSAIYWFAYEEGRNLLSDLRTGRNRNVTMSYFERLASRSRLSHAEAWMDSFVAGATAGAVAAAVTIPFDVGKTRQQVSNPLEGPSAANNASLGKSGGLRFTIPRFLWQIWKTEGAAGLFAGWGPRVFKVAPACAIMVSSYEIGKIYLGLEPPVDDE